MFQKDADMRDTCIITARKRNLGQGNVFTHLCHSVHGGWGVVAS